MKCMSFRDLLLRLWQDLAQHARIQYHQKQDIPLMVVETVENASLLNKTPVPEVPELLAFCSRCLRAPGSGKL